MLVLSRKLGEKIMITVPGAGELWITVVDIDRGKIRLGIDAPREWVVMRQELLPLPVSGGQQSLDALASQKACAYGEEAKSNV